MTASRQSNELGAQALQILGQMALLGVLDPMTGESTEAVTALKRGAASIVSQYVATVAGGRLHELACEAFDGLVEYHPLRLTADTREAFVTRAVLSVKSTGHDQSNYEAMRDAIERALEGEAAIA